MVIDITWISQTLAALAGPGGVWLSRSAGRSAVQGPAAFCRSPPRGPGPSRVPGARPATALMGGRERSERDLGLAQGRSRPRAISRLCPVLRDPLSKCRETLRGTCRPSPHRTAGARPLSEAPLQAAGTPPADVSNGASSERMGGWLTESRGRRRTVSGATAKQDAPNHTVRLSRGAHCPHQAPGTSAQASPLRGAAPAPGRAPPGPTPPGR